MPSLSPPLQTQIELNQLSKLQLDKRPIDRVAWDKNNERYYYKKSKKKVSDREIFSLLRSEQKKNAAKQEKLAQRMVNGQISFQEWQQRSKELIKRDHVAATRMAHGGKENTYAIHYLGTANDLRTIHYPAHRKFAEKIANGELSEKEIIARAKMYGRASKVTFEQNRASKYGEEYLVLRELGGCSPHCAPCLAYAARGWQPMSRFVPPGVACDCGPNCCCRATFKKISEVEGWGS